MNSLVLKLVAAAVLSLCGFFIGKTLGKAPSHRAGALSDFEYAMGRLENKMLFEKKPLSQALIEVGGDFGQAGALMESRELSPPEAWATASDAKKACLTAEDRAVLLDFFESLGGGGANEQKLLFSRTREAIRPLREAALSRYKEVSKLYSTLGALFGLGLSILLL